MIATLSRNRLLPIGPYMPYGRHMSITEAPSIPEVTLGWRMRLALAHADMSIEDMGDHLGVHRATISRWLNEHGTPPRDGFLRLWALRTGVPFEWLAHGVIPDPTPGPGTTLEYAPRDSNPEPADSRIVPFTRPNAIRAA